MQHCYDTTEPVSLYAELGKGSLTIEAAETAEATVDVDGPDPEEVSVELNGRQLSVVGPRARVGFFGGREPSYVITIRIPIGSDLVTKTGSAVLTATGEYGLARVKSGSGGVSLDRHSAAVVVDTGSGDVTISSAGADLRVKSGSGDVEVGLVAGTVGISTGSGDVKIGNTAAATVLKSGSGDLRVGDAGTDLSLSSASGDLAVGAFRRGSLTARNASGDVRVGIPAGIPVWTDVTSLSGRIGSDLEGAGQPAPGQDYIEVRAKTVSGDIVLKQLREEAS
jgi:DUF4097 and DUF4098 domain-containing protein YvlB